MFVPGSAEFFNMNKQQIADHPEVTAFFERMTFLPLEHITAMVPPGGAGIGMHVIPVEKAIETENQSLDIEHISHWLKKYEGKYAAGPCSCRMSRAAMGEGCGDDPDDWCIGVGDMADYLVETDKGHYVTYDEVMRDPAEGRGQRLCAPDHEHRRREQDFCHLQLQRQRLQRAAHQPAVQHAEHVSRSAYVAKVDPENCVACGRCVEFCPAGAVKLGQKLCTKNGPITYRKQELPDDKVGPRKWTMDYRDKNRINCYDTGTAPCKTACPAHIAVQGYLKMAAQGRYRDALALIKRRTPSPPSAAHLQPPVRGRLHPRHRRPGRGHRRGQEVHRRAGPEGRHRYVPEGAPPLRPPYTEKIAIIGGGPAGLSCAYFLAQQGYSPTVFEKNPVPGGMLTLGIPSFQLEKDVINAEIDILRELGVEFHCGVEVGKDITIAQLRAQGYKAFYVAIGCQGGHSGVPGEDARGRLPRRATSCAPWAARKTHTGKRCASSAAATSP